VRLKAWVRREVELDGWPLFLLGVAAYGMLAAGALLGIVACAVLLVMRW
jgi:hypothetical protein